MLRPEMASQPAPLDPFEPEPPPFEPPDPPSPGRRGAVLRPDPVPDLNWEPARARRFAEGAVDVVAELLERLPGLPVSRRWDQEAVERAVSLGPSQDPMSQDDLLAYLRTLLLQHSTYPGHPRFMGYITGAGTVPGAVADMVASAVNMNLGSWRLSPAATEVELALVRWFAAAFGLPESAGGLMVSGGAMANFVALKMARDAGAGWDVRGAGVSGGPPLVLYASDEVHVVIDRAADMLGLGHQAVRKVPTDDGYRMDVEALRAMLARDREAGARPFAVVATAGTVATGAIDPLEEVAGLCAAERLWMHVDAAYGGPAVLAEDLRPLLAGIERADSIAFDPHKWLYTPHSGGMVLVRDMTRQVLSYVVAPSYVHPGELGPGLDLGAFGPQFSRGWAALKVWVSLLAHGRRAYAARISHDAALARYLGARVQEHPELELAAAVGLSICCFRYVPPGLPEGPEAERYVSDLNEQLMTEIQADGRAFCSNALLEGRWALRACIVNFRTEAEDVDALLDLAVELGRALDARMRPPGLGSAEPKP
jgi:aromatic-L-amino-acid/L-tryptophan decarboxylase